MKQIAITCGDPAGIGPEVALRAALELQGQCEPLLYGPREVWAQAATLLQVSDLPQMIETPGGVVAYGNDSSLGGHTAIAAIDGALRSGASAIVTAPVSKTSLKLAGYDYPGQTEYFAEQCGNVPVAMMLAGPKLRVVLVSTHLSLRAAIDGLSVQGIVRTATIAHKSLSRFFGRSPRLALCALNPHAGEGGMFGEEEAKILAPAVEEATRGGVLLAGPFASDTLFVQAVAGRYDAVIVLFHDQGLIPLKLLHFDEGVNVTLGLPIVRTSPDHGTAFDTAGKGIAQASSMRAAIVQALALRDAPLFEGARE